MVSTGKQEMKAKGREVEIRLRIPNTNAGQGRLRIPNGNTQQVRLRIPNGNTRQGSWLLK